jgi:hypothetical protein
MRAATGVRTGFDGMIGKLHSACHGVLRTEGVARCREPGLPSVMRRT